MNYGEMFKEECLFEAAKKRLDDARDKLVSAQSEFIDAERRYNDASREYMNKRFPDRDVK